MGRDQIGPVPSSHTRSRSSNDFQALHIGTILKKTIYLGSLPLARVFHATDEPAVYFYHTDHLGTLVAVTGASNHFEVAPVKARIRALAGHESTGLSAGLHLLSTVGVGVALPAVALAEGKLALLKVFAGPVALHAGRGAAGSAAQKFPLCMGIQ